MGERGLQRVLAAIGGVATVFGLLGVAKGAAGVRNGGAVSASVDSELRFFASWYAVLGLLTLRAARQPEAEAVLVRACAGGFFLAACGRVLSMRAVGPPDPLFKALAAVEFAIPAVVLPLQRGARTD